MPPSGSCPASRSATTWETSHKHNVVLNGVTMTSSIKPEVHNISHRRQRRTEPQPQATCTKKTGEIWPRGFRVMQMDRQTHRHTNRHTHHNTLQSTGRSNNHNDHNIIMQTGMIRKKKTSPIAQQLVPFWHFCWRQQ